MYRRFIDSDNRPNAVVLSASEALIRLKVSDRDPDQKMLEFTGQLGAIQADRGYVGFTGVELEIALFKRGFPSPVVSNAENHSCINMIIENQSLIAPKFTIQILVHVEGIPKTYRTHPSGIFCSFRQSVLCEEGRNYLI